MTKRERKGAIAEYRATQAIDDTRESKASLFQLGNHYCGSEPGNLATEVAKEVTDLSQRQEQKTKNPALTKINAYTPLKSE